MKFLLELAPTIIFIIAYKSGGIFLATKALIIAVTVQVFLNRIIKGKFEKTQVITAGLLYIFGGTTLFLKNPLFIKWKFTIVYWLMSLAFILTKVFSKETLLQKMLGKNIELNDKIWYRLNLSWISFFFLIGLTNLYVLYNFDDDTWFNFKVYGAIGLFIIFIFIQGLFLTKHIKTKDES